MSTENSPQSLGHYTDLIRRRWQYPVLIIPAVMLLAVYLAYTLTPIYQSTATILLEPSSIRADLVQTTVISYADQRIELVQRSVMAGDSLTELVKSYDPYPKSGMTPEQKARQVRLDTEIERVDPVTLEPLNQSNAFSLHYYNPDPDRAAEIADRLAQLFLVYNKKTRTEAADEARRFLKQQSQVLAGEVKALDLKLAEFKQQHGDTLPEAQARNLGAVDRIERDLVVLETQIRAVLREHGRLSKPIDQLDVAADLYQAGMTSHASVSVMLALEDAFDQEFPDAFNLAGWHVQPRL